MELLLGINQTRVLSLQPDGPIQEVGQAVKFHMRMRGFSGGNKPGPDGQIPQCHQGACFLSWNIRVESFQARARQTGEMS